MSRVLVVDDKPDNTYYLEVLLSGAGFDVVTARHGAEALVLARQKPPDLVISDLLMPVMDGYTLLRYWKADERLRNVPFIVYTATYTEAADERLAYDLGGDAFILKPTEPHDLLARVDQVMAGVIERPSVTSDGVRDDYERVLRSYSHALIRKLEEKTLQLEEANLVLAADIEQRQRVETALRASEAEFRLLFESIPQIVWITEPDGSHVHFNQRWLDYTGLTIEESLGDGWNPPLHPRDRKRAERAWAHATQSGELYEIEYRLGRADGVYRWMLGRALPLLDADGSIVKWFGTCTDIDDLKAAEARIGEQAHLLDHAHDAIALHDRDFRIRYWNQGAERLHGWTADEAVGRLASDLHCPEADQLDHIVATLDRDGEWKGELELVDRDGADLIVEGRWTLLPDGDDGRGTVLAVNTDVTARKRMEVQLLRTQRLESIGTLASGMAHDLNNLLAPIVVGVGLIRRDDDDAVDRQILDTIEASAQRASRLVDQVLSFARGTVGVRAQVSIDAVLTEFMLIATSTFPANITVAHDVADGLWDVVGDATQLHQVFLNLCINARDAMPDGGTLWVQARNVDLGVDAAGGLRCAPGPHVVVSVHDNGTGVPPELVDRIFEPFLTTKQTGSGTGLGLSTVVGIVTGHGGVVTVDSEMGSGSVFEVYLPAVAEPVGIEQADDAPRSAAQRSRPGATVLVVDDERMIRELTKRVLESAGYRVLTADDGQAALDSYEAHRDEIGLVLTDMMMPRMDGHELCRALLERDPDLPMAMMSGVVGPTELEMAGVRQVLSKPFSTDRLLTMIGETLGTSS